MSLRLQQYRRKKARGELRNDLAYPLVVFALSAVFLAGYGLLNLGSPLCWAALSGAVVLTTVGYGMYRCRRWARWPAAAILTLGGAFGLLRVVADGPTVVTVLHTAVYGFFALYLALPATGELFQASGSVEKEA